MKWKFILDKPLPKGKKAYIVQKIDYKEKFFSSDSNKLSTLSHAYWEAWSVKDGDEIHTEKSHPDYSDEWIRTIPKGQSCGNIKLITDVHFYSFERIQSVEDVAYLHMNWENKKHPWSKDLPSTTEEPLWWGGKSSYGEKTIKNEMLIEWDMNLATQKISIIQNGKEIVNYEI